MGLSSEDQLRVFPQSFTKAKMLWINIYMFEVSISKINGVCLCVTCFMNKEKMVEAVRRTVSGMSS